MSTATAIWRTFNIITASLLGGLAALDFSHHKWFWGGWCAALALVNLIDYARRRDG